MTGLVARVRGALDPRCIVQSGLSKEGCKVSLAEVPAPRLTVDFDRPGSPLAADVPDLCRHCRNGTFERASGYYG